MAKDKNGNGNGNGNGNAENLPAVRIGSDYAVTQIGAGQIAEIIQENLGGQVIGARDLDVIKVPTGGSIAWTIPVLGVEEVAKDFTGVIIFKKDTRRYWKQRFEERSEAGPPDCYSDDSQMGFGDPFGQSQPQGHACARCPLAEWGSDPKNKKGQACKSYAQLFILQPAALLPTLLAVPPSSLADLRKFMVGLASRQIPYWAAVIKFSLAKAKNGNGVDYAEVVLSLAGVLEGAELETIKAYRAGVIPLLQRFKDAEVADVEPEAEQAPAF